MVVALAASLEVHAAAALPTISTLIAALEETSDRYDCAQHGHPASMEQIYDLIAQLKTFNNLLAELLRDRDQPAVSDVIRDHLIAVQRIEASFTAATEHLIAALRRQETLDRSSWDQSIVEWLGRLEAQNKRVLDLLGHPMPGPSDD